MNRKGALSIETIIVIILALLTLVIIAASFTGGMKNLWERISGIAQTTSGEISFEEAKTRCAEVCNNAPQSFASTSYLIRNVGPRNCPQITSCANV